ncbi:MAG: hypothetical protein V3T86_16740 [Planctomycetota bacterium]
MSRAAAFSIALLLYGVAQTHAGEPGPETRVFLETETARDTYFLEEPFRITLRIGFDREFFESNAVQMFQQRFDVPVQIHAPWLQEWPGARLRSQPGRGRMQRTLTLVLNGEEQDAIVAGEREQDGRTFTLLEIRRTVLPTALGDLEASAPRVQFACATNFRDDFVRGRVPLDRREISVQGMPRTISIRALPEEGKPKGFGGAVGHFSIRAEMTAQQVSPKTAFRLSLLIQGEGNLERFDPPRLDRLPGFHVYGVLDNKDQAAHVHTRAITYDLAIADAATGEIPAIPFTFFDPAKEKYRTVHTEPVALSVSGDATRSTETPTAAEAPIDFTLLIGAALVLFAFCVWIGVRIGTRRRQIDPDVAADAFRAQASQPGADLAKLLTEYLGARLGCPAASVISPDLAQRMRAVGVSADVAARTARLIESLVAARYGGSSPDEAAFREANSLVDALEPETRPGG